MRQRICPVLVLLLGWGVVDAFIAVSSVVDQVPEAARGMSVPVPGGMRIAEVSGERLPGCQDGTAPSCRGACPPFNVCQALRLRSFEICNCVGDRSVCGTADPLCGGVCPRGLVCAGDVFGFGSCWCSPPLPEVDEAMRKARTAKTATTTLPPPKVTSPTPSPAVGAATPRPPACEASAYPGCDGECSDGEVCIGYVDQVGFGNCGCFPVHSDGMLCSDATAPQCDAACPNGTACMADEGGVGCVCFDVFGAKCGFFGPPECAGECPPSAPKCRDDGAGGCECTK